METYLIEDLSFTYAARSQPTLRDISLAIQPGQFVLLLGASGSGKSTLLRQLKSVLTPHGRAQGRVLFEGQPLAQVEQRRQAAAIGFVQQNPDNQPVTDKVWHELAFGLESLGMDSADIRLRVAETASFFGVQTWFHQDVSQLSGGQKQLLNLAAVMVMQPAVLILDEPTSQLDPIAAADFLAALAKLNRELGTTVIVSEQRLEQALPLADRVLVLEQGRLLVDAPPREAADRLRRLGHEMFAAMPTPLRLWAAVADAVAVDEAADVAEATLADRPLTVREGRDWLSRLAAKHPLDASAIPLDAAPHRDLPPIISLREVSFSYTASGPQVVNKLELDVYPGELFALVGGNGTGKSTTLSLISGLLRPQRGRVLLLGRELTRFKSSELYNGLLGVLPQNPQSLFVKQSLRADLYEMFSGRGLSVAQQQRRVQAVTRLCELEGLLTAHPFDLSGGEQQRAALAKILLLSPKILLLDEPTKGLDAHFKLRLAVILKALQAMGVTVVMVSHDVEFCAAYADRCALMFDGALAAEQGPRAFFAGQRFYTTAAHRLAAHLLPQAVLAEDVLLALGLGAGEDGLRPEQQKLPALRALYTENDLLNDDNIDVADDDIDVADYSGDDDGDNDNDVADNDDGNATDDSNTDDPSPAPRRLSKRTWVALAMILLAIPLTIAAGVYFFDDSKYAFISLLIILETLLPFVLVFEDRRPQARELVVLAVLVGLAVAGRAAFFMLPNFKPVLAIVIIAGVTLGAESGFLVGALTGLVSNFFFGQGPWTPWQMFAFGVIGFLAGLLFQKGRLSHGRVWLCSFGGLTALVVYGLLLDTANVLMYQSHPTWAMLLTSYSLGLPFNLAHAASTVIFLWLLAEPLIKKLERMRLKYGLIE